MNSITYRQVKSTMKTSSGKVDDKNSSNASSYAAVYIGSLYLLISPISEYNLKSADLKIENPQSEY